MAEAIGVASGLLALATFAFQSSVTLFKTVQSFQFHPKRVRDLLEELQALSGVLSSLTKTVGAATDVDLSSLDLPMLRCGNACKEFEQEIMKCSSRSGGGRTSFRDWAKLKYMGDDIDSFRQLLSGYKSTIIIALTDASL
jgi:Fungal N-terminal domain of STAND proteins